MSNYQAYQSEKQKLQNKNLTPSEYQKELKKLCSQLKVMDFKEIEKLAYSNNILLSAYPSQIEQLAYLSMRSLYNDFKKNNINKDQAQQDEAMVKKSYEDAVVNYQRDLKLMKEINDMRIALSGYSKLVEQGTCERCKAMLQIFDGRIKP